MKESEIGGYILKLDQIDQDFDLLFTKLKALEEELVDEGQRYKAPIKGSIERLEASYAGIKRFKYVLVQGTERGW